MIRKRWQRRHGGEVEVSSTITKRNDKHLSLKNRRSDAIDSHGTTLIDKHGDNYTKSWDIISPNVRVPVFSQ